ncbi:hypothetical protein D9613_008300 [Agrocybe pediades]|uniref:Uncharacterized protein n=1 Tax=Agrocybe pediades TaxID=84607 RepID=A0A8H4QSQ2_9AGAR|nr:hypothetical protein D9613_008300 [Agrocybe pediades]
MLILASIFLSRSTRTNDSFSSIPDALFSSNFPRDADPTPPCPRQRIEIIWTCVATILAASWVSVHPNIPDVKESKIKKTLRRIELMIWAIITPELIIFWAMRQWYGARLMEREFAVVQHTKLEPLTRKILRTLKELGDQLCHFRASEDEERIPLTREPPREMKRVKWTRTHSFFLQMGGFMLREEGKKDRVLGWKALKEYYKQGRLDLSDITEDRINDHSKADGFAKGLALLQMFWFITQCVARFFDENLILTELELATGALALLSLVMYLSWWNKPFNAEVPITITLLPAGSIDTSPIPIPDADNPNIPHADSPVESTHSSGHRGIDEENPSNLHLRQSDSVYPPASHLGSAEDSNAAFAPPPNPPPNPQSAHSRAHSVSGSQRTDLPSLSPTIESDKSSEGEQWWFLFLRIDEITGNNKTNSDIPGDSAVTSVPSFYAVPTNSYTAIWQTGLTSFSAAALFGSIHCIGWSSKIMFTSHATLLAWRIASAVITASPVVWCLMVIFGYVSQIFKDRSMLLERMFYYFAMSCGIVSIATIPVYITARLALLVLALVELQHVPPGALANIQWANVLPFIH